LEGAGVQGDPTGRNSSSRVFKSSQWVYSSTRCLGKSPESVDRGMSCNICESPGFRVRKIKSPLLYENRIFKWFQSLQNIKEEYRAFLYLISRNGRSSHIVHSRDVSRSHIENSLKETSEKDRKWPKCFEYSLCRVYWHR